MTVSALPRLPGKVALGTAGWWSNRQVQHGAAKARAEAAANSTREGVKWPSEPSAPDETATVDVVRLT